ncbi:MAG: 16S rRNA (cytidine(1402)-2'-O)-methyltransferase [bacterium]
MAKGTLYIVSTPIGNPADITQRAIEVITDCAILVCEETKPTNRLLARLKLQKELLLLNEHTTQEATAEAVQILEDGKNIALISDDGTPLVADPGSELVRECIERGISVVPIPGASSILAAIVASGFALTSFTFCGFLPRDKQERKSVAASYKNRKETLIFLEAPYRLAQLLQDMADGLGKERKAVLGMNLTVETEQFKRGTLGLLLEYFTEHPFKGEFVLVIEGSGHSLLPQRNQRHQKL